MTAGTVKCWGFNGSGELGNNSNTSSDVPVDVSGIASGAATVSVGGSHACAVVSGTVQCWGLNTFGQLGNGSNTDSNFPVTVQGIVSGATQVSAGENHTCAL